MIIQKTNPNKFGGNNMAKSTAKAEAVSRDLKDRLESRGFTVAESKTATGWPRLDIDTDQASIEIEAADAVSKDIFGNDNKAFAPHEARLASVTAQSKADLTKIELELAKVGIDKTILKEGANLAAAEATAGEEIIWDVRWPTKGS
jgi:tRNA U34 5-carboxymethylaminomethyl modifying enzyme MnmG/GidA